MRRRYADAVALDVLAAERKEIQRLSAVVVVVFSAALELFAEAERSEALSLRHFYAALYRLALGLCRIEKRLVALGIVARLLCGSLGTVVICILCLKQQLLAELLRAVLHDNSPPFLPCGRYCPSRPFNAAHTRRKVTENRAFSPADFEFVHIIIVPMINT